MSTDWPSALAEAGALRMSVMCADDPGALRDIAEPSLFLHLFNLGMYIRSEFALWQGNDDLLASCFPDVTDPHMLMIIKHDPDRASGVIIDALWRRLQRTR